MFFFWFFVACAVMAAGFLLFINLSKGPIECGFCHMDITTDPDHCCEAMQKYIDLTDKHYRNKPPKRDGIV